MTDPFEPKQYCELHEGPSERVELLQRRQGPLSLKVRLMVCPKCMSELTKAGLVEKTAWAGVDCYEMTARAKSPARIGTQPYEMRLTPSELHCLRAMGFTVKLAADDPVAELSIADIPEAEYNQIKGV